MISELLIPEKEAQNAKVWFQKREWNKIAGRILIYPFDDDNLGPFTYDLSVGEQAYSIREDKEIDVAKEGYVTIQPGETVLILTREFIGLPQNITGLIEMRARLVLQGVVASATKADPTWYGRLAIAVANHSKGVITLRYKEPFCSLVLMKLDKPCKKVLTKDRIPYLGEESIRAFYRPINIKPTSMKKPETVTMEDLDEIVEVFGPPFDRVRGMFNLLRKNIVDYVEHEWGPHVLREIEHRATMEAFRYLKWMTGGIVVAIFILVIGFIIKLFV
jgi:deoxycytidine triphosphate deaminase